MHKPKESIHDENNSPVSASEVREISSNEIKVQQTCLVSKEVQIHCKEVQSTFTGFLLFSEQMHSF